MTPLKFITLARWRAGVNTSSPWDNTSMLSNVNFTISDMALAIMKVNPDYFEDTATTDSISGQQEYTKPSDLQLLKRFEISYTNSSVGSFKPAKLVTLSDLVDQGEDWYYTNQSTSNPLVRLADTGFRTYPRPNATTAGVAFIRLFYVPTRPSITDLTDDTTDIENTTGLGAVFHEAMVDMLVNQIRAKKKEITALDVQKLNAEIKSRIDPAAYRVPTTFTSALPSDSNLQI